MLINYDTHNGSVIILQFVEFFTLRKNIKIVKKTLLANFRG